MSEGYLFNAMLLGIVSCLVGWIWLAVAAWRDGIAWGLGVTFVPPLAIPYGFLGGVRLRRPLGLVLLGLALTLGPFYANRLLPVDLGPYEQLVDGERHVTLTGWDRTGYDFLRGQSDIVVLQMANDDVSDETLDLVTHLRGLRELDLSNTKVSDVGLRKLRQLPRLERLRLANTRVSEAGFHESLASLQTLRELDLRGTSISKETITHWRKAQPGRRALR